jgi:hypothetical protein
MDSKDREVLRAAGWPPELLESLKTTPSIGPIDRKFLRETKNALAASGHEAVELLRSFPADSLNELVDRLGHDASGFGLLMAIYEDAQQRGVVRQVAKDLLLRRIRERFPLGWIGIEEVSPLVRLGSWETSIEKYCPNTQYYHYARDILRELTINNQPHQGWRPEIASDPLIDGLFDRYWPLDPDQSSH